MNLRNFACFEGRLTSDPKILPNADGSRKVLLNLAVQDNFESTVRGDDGTVGRTRKSQFISLEAFLSKENKTNGAYAFMEKGDLVGIQAEMRSSSYVDKAGAKQYRQYLFIQGVDLKETKASKQARKAKAAEAATAAAPAAVAPQAVAAPAMAGAVNPAAMTPEQYQAYLAACQQNVAGMPFSGVQ